MLEILVGPIASGKTTYALQRARMGGIIVNDDAIVTALHGGEYTLYRRGLKPLYKHLENQIVHVGLSFGSDVLIDRPCMKKATRARYIALARSLDEPVRCVLFPMQTPEVHANRRFNSNNRGYSLDYWERVASAHYRDFETPTIDEGFQDIVTPAQALELAAPHPHAEKH